MTTIPHPRASPGAKRSEGVVANDDAASDAAALDPPPQRGHVRRKVGPGNGERSERRLPTQARAAQRLVGKVAEAGHRDVHRHLLVRDRRTLDEGEERA